MSALTLLNRSSQFVKSGVGTEPGYSPREQSFCDYTVRSREMFTVADTQADIRFQMNPIVTGDPHIRFYSGVPVQTESGAALGALCVLDTEPRTLSEEQEWALQMLGRLLSARVQLHVRTRAAEEQHRELERQRELLRVFLDSLPLEACVKDAEGRFLLYNRAVAEHFGVTTEAWLGKTDYDLFDKEKADQLRMEEEHVLRSGKRQESYMELDRPPHGREYWKMIKAPLVLEGGVQLLSAVAVNLTVELQREAHLMELQNELEEANQKLQSLSLTDSLTGLWNRRAFDSRLETEIFNAERTLASMTLLLFDIDNFKQLNDTFGHSHGDEVLQELSAVLRRAIRTNDVAVRYGGEEFAIILPKASADGGRALCTRIASMLERVRWKYRPVTVSFGIAAYEPGLHSDDLLDRADKALYEAKRNGKNCAVVYDGDEAAPVPAA
jgi:diguanylate cyclase (GGDEF)-like protein/PAS domain S-box-containing protein